MAPHTGNAHLYTALAYYLIGLAMIAVAIKVWWTHPVNRAFMFGPYVTPAGIAMLLRLWPFVALFGAFILSCALDHHADWLAARGLISYEIVDTLGTIEAIISVFTALSICAALARAVWHKK